MSNTVGLRQLRLHLGEVLERVRRGETLQVTDRGVPVATLSPPAGGGENLVAGLRARGLSVTAARPDDWWPAPLPATAGLTTEQALEEQRADRH